MCMFFKKNKKIESAIDQMNNLWDTLSELVSREDAMRLRQMKSEVNKYFASDAKINEKDVKAKAISAKLSAIIAPAKRTRQNVPSSAMNNFLTEVGDMFETAPVDMGQMGNIIQQITNGKYDNILPTPEIRNEVLSRLSVCFDEINHLELNADQQEKLDQAMGTLHSVFFTGASHKSIIATIKRIEDMIHVWGIVGSKDSKLTEVYNTKVGSVDEFLGNAEGVTNVIETERKKANNLSEALQTSMQEIARKCSEARTAGKTQEVNSLKQDFATEQSKRNAEINKSNILYSQGTGLKEIQRLMELLKNAGVSDEKFEPLIKGLTYGQILGEDYEYIIAKLKELLETIGVHKPTKVFEEFNQKFEQEFKQEEEPIDPELEAMMAEFEKSEGFEDEFSTNHSNKNNVNN